MAFAYVQGRGLTGSSLAFSSNVVAGNLLVVCTGEWAGSNPSAVTDSVGTTYLLCGSPVNNGYLNATIWFGIAGGSGANTVTATGLTGTSGSPSILLAEYTVPATFSIVGTHLWLANTGGPCNYPCVKTITETELIFFCYDAHSSHTWTMLNGTTQRLATTESGGQSLLLCDINLPSGVTLGNKYGFVFPASGNLGALGLILSA